MEQADHTALKNFLRREAGLLEENMRADLAEALSGCDPLLTEVLEYALFGGGKRVRPVLAVLAARICGCTDPEVYRLAVAFEYLHVATLVHDDVIDNAETRRGREAVGRHYGVAAAILAGDWLHARSMSLIGRYTGKQGLEVFCRATIGMVDGEFLQLRSACVPDLTEEEYYAVIHRKTALLIESTCEIGALFGGCSRQQQQALAAYGRKLGSAFQVVDDLLDYEGDTAHTGKQTGNDFAEGKITLPFIRAYQAATPGDKEKLAALLAEDRSDRDVFSRFSGLLAELEGFVSARKAAEQLAAEAVSSLRVFHPGDDPESLAVLEALAAYVLKRNK